MKKYQKMLQKWFRVVYHDGEEKWQQLNFDDCQDWHFCETLEAGTNKNEIVDSWTIARRALQRSRARTMSRDLGAEEGLRKGD